MCEAAESESAKRRFGTDVWRRAEEPQRYVEIHRLSSMNWSGRRVGKSQKLTTIGDIELRDGICHGFGSCDGHGCLALLRGWG